MTNNPFIKPETAKLALTHIPPLIANTLLEKKEFTNEYGITLNAVLSVDNIKFAIQRSTLYNAIRNSTSNGTIVEDDNGGRWNLLSITTDGKSRGFKLTDGHQEIVFPELFSLSPDRSVRLHNINEIAKEINMSSAELEKWQTVLDNRALYDDEVELLNKYIQETPIKLAQSIRRRFLRGSVTKELLVPTSFDYYSRLVGTYDDASSVNEYAIGNCREFIKQLSSWHPYDGLMFSLFLSSHLSLTSEIDVDHLSNEELVRAYDFLDKNGDRLSQIGAIEIGLRIFTTRPEIEQHLIRLIEQIRDDDSGASDSRFKLLSTLFMFVDSELIASRLFTSKPPFYRRLAALAQAALISRQLISVKINISSFCEWLANNLDETYYLQTLIDMRSEPRWYPELAEDVHLKANYLGRIITAALNFTQDIKDSKLYDLILGSHPDSLSKFTTSLDVFFPGPLEGGEETPNALPLEISKAIDTQLSSEVTTLSSFIALVNSALIFRIGIDQSELAAKALKLGSYRLANVQEKSQLLTILNGLATVAAISRSCALADDLRIVVRRYMHDAQFALSIEESMRIFLISASSREDPRQWRTFLGDCLNELAFGELRGKDGELLYSYLQSLCGLVPELWISCSRAEAALVAFNTRSQSWD
ncbi:hypothetical protein ACFPVX_02600 [Cohnella faecalis]|uniref:GreAB-C-like domain-containing protein n=1 Tax=Cohnella faecalis TaxID=2315694 RepID=A0A398CZC5_9BACL|nr:hypothetical protein [Cohnella faecalis]RIE05207.1 hypothetical protein D3H35_01415 [Cohnella faecalis]